MTSDLLSPPGLLQTQALIERARNGSQLAWQELYRRYYALLTVMVHVRLPGCFRGRFDTQDVLQSAFIATWHQIAEFDYQGEGTFRKWLSTVVVNKLKDLMRHHQRDKRSLAQEAEPWESPQALRVVAEGDDPAAAMARIERQAEVLAQMSLLSEEDQHVVCMRIFERLTWSQMAAILECSSTTVRKHYARAIERLTQGLE